MNIGLFAPVGSGKTTVLGIFSKQGWTVINQDDIAHQLLTENSIPLSRIFGEEILEQSQISRQKLGAIVFADAQKRQTLEDFLYPLIHSRTKALFRGNTLVEGANLYKVLKVYAFDKTLTITLPLPLLKTRLSNRGHSAPWIEAVLAAQKGLFLAQKKADITITNKGTLQELEESVKKLILSLG